MKTDATKTKSQLIDELKELQNRTAELEKTSSARKIIEESVQVSETRYRRLFETAPDGILILNAETGQIDEVNPFLIKMLGYSREEFIGKKLWEIGPFKDIIASKTAFAELQNKKYIRYEDLPLETGDGRQIAVEFVGNVYEVDHTKVIQCNIRDITDRKQAEKAALKALEKMMDDLARSNRDLEQFAYVASHDLQEPLRMVSSFTQLLAQRYKDKLDKDAREFIGFVIDGANRMQQMISDLLIFSRIATREKPLALVDCNSVLGQVHTNLLLAIEESGAGSS
ncbi:MAG: PAS domain S-box protein [bacterium]|nr:PAS domain S-box protein [bacterium]